MVRRSRRNFEAACRFSYNGGEEITFLHVRTRRKIYQRDELSDSKIPLGQLIPRDGIERDELTKDSIVLSSSGLVLGYEEQNVLLAARFRLFEKPMPYSPEKVVKIVKTCCALHNWLRQTKLQNKQYEYTVDSEHFETGTIVPGRPLTNELD
ncbi:hypothetical protein HW555_002087 [Spodoptera exigua]|uniref:DDE Tnp4 domain-containing protein n=1 Tax=Spodoptera exigua TaxID=7107 RepID=A0A835GQ67_SPOEX|nr:hypothetical protein HW555_002087 [Spodoptera exigua]